MTKSNPSLPREIVVSVGDKEITVRKLPLGRIAALAGLLDAVPGLIQEVAGDDELRQAFAGADSNDYVAMGSTIIKALPKLLGTAEDFVVSLIATGADLEKSFVRDEVGFDEALELLAAIFTVNNLAAIQRHAKNLIRLFGVDPSRLMQRAKLPAPAESGSKT